MYLRMGISLVAVALLATISAPARGQVINEEFKILASDGDAGSEFGFSIAIDQASLPWVLAATTITHRLGVCVSL